MGTKIGLTGITFGDATVQNTAATTGVTSLVAGTGISVSGATGAVTVSATGGGTVTSVATGNGLSGGTITGSGTLVIAAPDFNSVGSYCWVGIYASPVQTWAAGASLSAGSGAGQVSNLRFESPDGQVEPVRENTLSGSWRVFNRAQSVNSGSNLGVATLACRIS
jgi:hypothetical protein